METRTTQHRIQLDSHLGGTRRFWKLLEEHCVIDCCGLDALDLSVERILSAGEKVNSKALVMQLETVIAFIESHPTCLFQSRDVLCCGGPKEKFMSLFQRVQHILLGISA
ncbi:MAG: DUF6331 family protein [Bacteroidota bacterium]